MSLPSKDQVFVDSFQSTNLGKIPQVSSNLTSKDKWGAIKVRSGIGRHNYKLEPGLYALGKPDKDSHVIVTANYKLSFDILRQSLDKQDLWILVLDTDGVNVWCAAGKGTFGTEELVRRIECNGLSYIISHRKLILPQLSAPGISAHKVKKLSGFKVIFGPIESKDLPVFLDNELKASPEMRQKTFFIGERAVLIPVEIAAALKPFLFVTLILLIFEGIGGTSNFWTNLLNNAFFSIYSMIVGLFAGAVFTPLFLPWLPGRAFSVKGLITGVLAFLIFLAPGFRDITTQKDILETISWFILIPTISSFLAMNFTGSSTYTSLSGVKKEMKIAVPIQITGGIVGFIIWLISKFI